MNAYAKPGPAEHAPFYQRYIDAIPADNLMQALLDSLSAFKELVKRLPPGSGDYSYAPGKWTIKDVLQHMIDTERVMAYRGLRFARNDATPLPGFEEDDYARHASTTSRTIDDLTVEMEIVRGSSILLYQTLSEEALLRQGAANGQPCSARATGWIIAGHMMHHIEVINERYLQHASA